MKPLSRVFFVFFTVIACFAALGCQKAYYAAWETLGKEKRHLLKDQVEEAREDQEKASQEFTDALTRLQSLYGVQNTELESFYNKLSSDYKACRSRAESVKSRVTRVETVASDLFSEWEKEIQEISNASLRQGSEKRLAETRQRFARLKAAMNKAAASMDPVLENLRDYVLYLKHNLNAQAIGTLKKETRDIGDQVKTLVADMNKSIAEAEAFIKTLE